MLTGIDGDEMSGDRMEMLLGYGGISMEGDRGESERRGLVARSKSGSTIEQWLGTRGRW